MEKNNQHFALSNPISILTGKSKNDWTRDDLIKVILEKQIEIVTFNYTGIDGKLKELKIPIADRKHAELILSEGERCDGSSLFKGMVDPGKSDLYVVPVYKTAFLNPFDDKSLNIICRFMDRDGNLADFAPDNILKKASDSLTRNTGIELHSFGELEFYLIGKSDMNIFPLEKQKGYHATAPFTKTGQILNEMLRYVTQITGNVKYAHSEVGSIRQLTTEYEELKNKSAEQVEIELLETPVDEAADMVVLSGWIIRNVAYKHGYIATFFPKLDFEHAGNGLHFHNSLMRNGENIMTNDKGELSEEAKQLIGGLCHYAPSLTAFGNMVSSSYLRLVPHHEAPTKVCWSESNRSALIRVPLAWTKFNNLAMKVNPQQTEKHHHYGSRQTVELRSPDGSANVHLLLAGVAMATEWGLTNPKDSMILTNNSYVSHNIHTNPNLQELAELATSCVESSELLLQQRMLFERDGIFPRNVIDFVSEFLQRENDLNLNKRLMALPDEEKLVESRRIMHKHLNRH
jgi:glutamine synthetase